MKLSVRPLLIVVAGIAIVVSPGLANAAGLTNQLKHHSSPYLALHGDDPVAWQDWRASAIKAARRQNKLLFVSIGYFSCHWCHVMQRESYRNPEIASYLNRHFVAVKVDRELEPALDARLIAFVEKTQGISGWPLNVFITPEGYPLYAVLYMPPAEFKAVLSRLQQLWQQDRENLKQVAREAVGGGRGPGTPALSRSTVQGYVNQVVQAGLGLGDPFNGGFGEQSKFPSVPQLNFFLHEYQQRPDPRLKELLTRTLDNMMRYGLYDHLGGGFFRYAVDPGWRTPHFEKMLYDNAQMAQLYLRAARVWNRADYARVGYETLAFITSDMRRSNGGFISALSAIDSNGVEGGYYLWRRQELEKILLPDELKVFLYVRGMTDAPAFDQGYLPMRLRTTAEAVTRFSLPEERVQQLLVAADRKVLNQRTRRSLPEDTKMLAGWNGLVLSAFSQAARTEASPEYRKIATELRDYLVHTHWTGKQLHRSKVNGRVIGHASLEDYAQVSRGLLDYARLTGRAGDYQLVRRVVDSAWRQFYGNTGWRLGEASLIQAEPGADAIADGPMPAPSGSLMSTALELAESTRDKALRERTLAALNSGHEIIASDPFWYVSHIDAMRRAIGHGPAVSMH
jgi:uncharacterized protein YyaL (SSP411 family)